MMNPNSTIDHNAIRRARKATQRARAKGRPAETGFTLADAAKERRNRQAFLARMKSHVDEAASPEGLTIHIRPIPSEKCSTELYLDGWDKRRTDTKLVSQILGACKADPRHFVWNKDWEETNTLTIRLAQPKRKAA